MENEYLENQDEKHEKWIEKFTEKFDKSFENLIEKIEKNGGNNMEESTDMNLMTKSMKPKLFKSEEKMQAENLGGQAILQTRINERIRENQMKESREELAEESQKQKLRGSEHFVL